VDKPPIEREYLWRENYPDISNSGLSLQLSLSKGN
jgi:hypothetical protein